MRAEEIEIEAARIGTDAEDVLEVEAVAAAHLGAANENIEETKMCKQDGILRLRGLFHQRIRHIISQLHANVHSCCIHSDHGS